jgi:chitodextrinase
MATGTTTASVFWGASTDNVGVTRYEVSRDGTVIRTLGSTTRSLSDTGLTAGTGYTYSVVALDAAGNRSIASTATVTTRPPPDTTAPAAPTGLAAAALSGLRISLAWQATTDNVGVTGYRIYRNGTQIRQVTSLTYTDRVYSTSATYTYTVKAVDAAGNLSAASNAVAIRAIR